MKRRKRIENKLDLIIVKSRTIFNCDELDPNT